MLPDFTINDCENSTGYNPEPSAEHLSIPIFVNHSYEHHFLFYEFMVEVINAMKHWVFVSILGNTIPNVIGVGSNKKMVRVYARRIVTFVTDMQSVGWSVVNNPTRNVCSNALAQRPVSLHVPVAIGKTPSPNPTPPVVWNYENPFPKTLFKIFTETLRFSKLLCKLELHRSRMLICAKLLEVSASQGHFYSV